MSELQNPLFDEEKEFLERKKQEYERALRGDMAQLKDQSLLVGKVALVGAGVGLGIWLIAKTFAGKKRRKLPAKSNELVEADHEFGAGATASGQELRGRHQEAAGLGFGSAAGSSFFSPKDVEDDPFQDLPYDGTDGSSPATSARPGNGLSTLLAKLASPRFQLVGTMLQAFLQSETGRVMVAQAAAVAVAVVTKKVGEFFPTTKNTDLADSPGSAPTETEVLSAASTPSASSDASNFPQSL